MPDNNNEAKKYKTPQFNHIKENYQIFEGVIIQSEKEGFDEWQFENDQTPKLLAEYLLFLTSFFCG